MLWKRLERLEVPAWQARRVAHQTHRLPYAGARWVDEQLAGRTGCGPVIVDRLVAQAIAQFDPEEHQKREDDAKADSDVALTHPEATDFAGTSHLEARGDTLTLQSVLRPGLRPRPPAATSTATRTPSAPGRSRPSG